VRSLLSITSLAVAAIFATAVHSEDIGDADRGVKVFKKCKACHKVGTGAKNGVGPHLNGVFGRAAAGFEDYKYSKSMDRAGADGLIWTEETLDAFLENPKSLVSKTKMNFKGLKKEADRANLLAYLRTFSDDPANIPEAEPTAHQTIVAPEILAIKGDAEYGEYLSNDCMTCHQVSGGDDGIPSIIGWPEEDFAVAMHAYKQKLRPHPVMQMMAGRLSNEEIAALAAYFNGLE
jgi:cytochrome c